MLGNQLISCELSRFKSDLITNACDQAGLIRSTPYLFIAFLNALPAVNLTVFVAAI